MKAPFKEFNELDVEDTVVEADETISVEKRPLEVLPRTGEEIAFRLMGCPECVEYS